MKERNTTFFFIIPFVPASGKVLLAQQVSHECFPMVTLMLLLMLLPARIKLSLPLLPPGKVSSFIYIQLLPLPIFQQAVIDPDKIWIFKTSFLRCFFSSLWNPTENEKQKKTNLEMPYGRCHLKHLCINLISILKITGTQNLWLCYLVNNVSEFFSLERPLNLSVASGHGCITFCIY